MNLPQPPGGPVVLWARRAVVLAVLLIVIAVAASLAGWLLVGLGHVAGWLLRIAVPAALVLVVVAVILGAVARRRR